MKVVRGQEGRYINGTLERISRAIEGVYPDAAAELLDLRDTVNQIAIICRVKGSRAYGYDLDGAKNPEEWPVVESICKAGRTGWTYAKIQAFVMSVHHVELPRPTIHGILIREKVRAAGPKRKRPKKPKPAPTVEE